MNILKIDTSNNLMTSIELEKSGRSFNIEEKRGKPGDQNVLRLIEKILKDNKIKLEDLNSIEVNTSSGSFTGLRVGVAIANALAFGINVSVNGKKLGEIAEPTY